MAVDVVYTCNSAIENESSQMLAIVLSIFFLIYTGVTILLAGLQLFYVSNKPHAASPRSSSVASGDAPNIAFKR